MSSITAKLINAKNAAYAQALKLELLQIPIEAAKAATREIYSAAVQYTVQDSGLAAYSWWIATGKDPIRQYDPVGDTAGVGRSGDKRSAGTGDFRVSGSPQEVIAKKLAYMEKVIAGHSSEFISGAVIYNMTPTRTPETFKGSYEGNAKIRVAVESGLMQAEAAVMALSKLGFKIR